MIDTVVHSWAQVTRRGFVVIAVGMVLAPPAFAQRDPLPSWNDGPTKQAILSFVTRATQQGGPDFVPVKERIAVFDMDGTLIPEKPVPAMVVPLVADIRERAARDPILRAKPAVAAVLRNDFATLYAMGEHGLNEVIAAVTDGKTTEQVVKDVRPVMQNAQHEKFGVPLIKAVYQPMRELLVLLAANGFTNWICSGSPVLLMRQISDDMFGIPPERVLGSYLITKFAERDGRSVLVFDGQIGHLNDREGKPVTLSLALSGRPAFVAGNEGGRGDIAMMRWSKDRDGPSFQLLINHDDAEREYAYAEPDNYSLEAAKTYGFHVVNMTSDWKTIVGK